MNKFCWDFKTSDLQAFEQSQPLDKMDESNIRMTLTSGLRGEELLATTLGKELVDNFFDISFAANLYFLDVRRLPSTTS